MKKLILVMGLLSCFPGGYALGQGTDGDPVPGKGTAPEPAEGRTRVFGGEEKIRFRPVDRDRRGKVHMLMGRPLVAGDQIYLRLKIRNRSSISYDVDFFRFFVRDRRIARRTITQEQELRPIRSVVPVRKVPAGEKAYFLFVMDKFTLADEKVLRCEAFEDRGGRHFQLQLTDRDINRAKS